MKKITHTFEISQPAWELLLSLAGGNIAEYRDNEYESVEEYKNDRSICPTNQMVSNFLSRNSNGSLYLAHELLKHNLVEPVDMAWHTTYQISELGLEVLKNNL